MDENRINTADEITEESTEKTTEEKLSEVLTSPAPRGDGRNRLWLHIAMIVCFAAAAALHFGLAYHTYALVPLIGGVIALLLALAELFTRRIPLMAGVAVLTLLVFMSQIAGPMRAMGQEGYAQQHAYQRFLLREAVAHFPDELPDNAQDYSMKYDSMFDDELPLYAVQFRTDTDTAAMLAHKAEASAVSLFNYSDYLAQTDVYRRKMELMTGNKDYNIAMYTPMEIKEPEGWRVYIQFASIRQNIPKTGAVMVNVDSGEVCYFRYG